MRTLSQNEISTISAGCGQGYSSLGVIGISALSAGISTGAFLYYHNNAIFNTLHYGAQVGTIAIAISTFMVMGYHAVDYYTKETIPA